MDHWQLWVKLLGDHIHQVTLLTASTHFPSGSLQEESVDVGTVLGGLGNLSRVSDVDDISLQDHVIQSQVVSSGSDLLDGGQE